MSNEISVCLFCYQAVIQLKWGESHWIDKSRCRHCGRMFVLDLKRNKRNKEEDHGSGRQSETSHDNQRTD